MDEFRPRTELSPVDRTMARPVTPVRTVQPAASSNGDVGADANAHPAVQRADPSGIDPDLASATQYAEVHARVSEILADLDQGMIGVNDAADTIQGMIPRPMVIVPLPPASREAVLHAEAVAKRIVERAANSGSVHARLARAAVEQVVAP